MTTDHRNTAASTPPDVSIVIACYNEEQHLEASVIEILATMERTVWSAELIFVEDCSTDGTRAVVERIVHKYAERMPMQAIYHQHNTGRGRTVTDGMRAARGRVVGFLDIDLEVHCRYIPAMMRAIEEGADFATAERIYHVNPTPIFLLRHVLSRGYRQLAARVLDLPDLDTEAGFKFFERRKLLPLLDLCRDPGWFWDTEIAAYAQRSGLKITAVPCLFLRRHDKQSTLKIIPATIEYLRRLRGFRRELKQWQSR